MNIKVDDPHPLTYQEAVDFVEDVMHIPDCQKLVDVDPLSFLDKLARQMKSLIPFTSIPHFTEEGPQLLSSEEWKACMLTCRGGPCAVFNSFAEAVLKRLGLRTYCAPASLYRRLNPQAITHLGIIIKDLTQSGSLHLVDPGSALPTFDTIPLDFESSSPTHSWYGQHLKYFKASIGAVNLCRRVDLGHLGKLNVPSLLHFEGRDFWNECLTYNIHEQRGLSYFRDIQGKFIEDVKAGKKRPPRGVLRLVGYPDGTLVDINSTRCLTVDENGVKNVTSISNVADYVNSVCRFFPQLSADDVASAAQYLLGYP